MSDLNEVGERDGWRCWLCDAPVDPSASVNADQGPSVDSFATARAKKGERAVERLAHRACNTQRGKTAPVVPWAPDLFVVDPAPIVAVVERLARKGGREVVARCPDAQDAQRAADWLLDRLARYAPDVSFAVEAQPGGGQFMLVLRAERP
jgi:hypothetical protein